MLIPPPRSFFIFLHSRVWAVCAPAHDSHRARSITVEAGLRGHRVTVNIGVGVADATDAGVG